MPELEVLTGPVAPFWDRPAGVVVLAVTGEDLPASTRSLVVRCSHPGQESSPAFLGEVRLPARKTLADGETVTYFLLVRPEQEAPFTLELLLGNEESKLEPWQQVSFETQGGGEAHVCACVLRDPDGGVRMQAEGRSLSLALGRKLASEIGAVSLFAAPLTQGGYGPVRYVHHGEPQTLHVLSVLRQRDPLERQQLEQEIQALPEEQRLLRARELELKLPDEWLNLYVGPFSTESEALEALARLEFGVIRYHFARQPDPEDPRTARVGRLRRRHIALRAAPEGGLLIRARFRELAHLDSVYVTAREGLLLQEWSPDGAVSEAGRSLAFVFLGDQALRDRRLLWDHEGGRQTAEQLAQDSLQEAGEPEGISIGERAAALFTQEMRQWEEQAPEVLRSLEQAAERFGLSPHREADVVAHANLFMALQSRRARERLLAAGGGTADPSGGAMAVVRETLKGELPGQADAVERWLQGQAGYPIWRSFLAGHDFTAQVTQGAPLPESF